jgi:hypothetical protein
MEEIILAEDDFTFKPGLKGLRENLILNSRNRPADNEI